MIFAKVRWHGGASFGLVVAVMVLSGCTSAARTGGAVSTPRTSTATTPARSATSQVEPSNVGSSVPPATNQSYGTASATFGTPSVPPLTSPGDALRIVVAGAGSSETPVTGVTCAGSQINAQVGSGTLTLNPTAGTLRLQNVVPVDTVEFSGTAARSGSVVTFAGAGTGTSVALRLTCA